MIRTPPGPEEPGTKPYARRHRAALRRALIALCVTQITSHGVLYYAFPVMLTSVSRDTGWSAAGAMGAFSTGAIVSAVAGVVVGRLIDRYGPRPVMTAGSVLGVVSVAAIATGPNLPTFYAAWVLAGTAQAAVLYPPAFAALTGWYGPDRVRALTTLTLVAGFASTIFAPLTAALLDHLAWRETYLVLGVVLAVVTIPSHALLLTPPWNPTRSPARDTGAGTTAISHAATVVRSRAFVALTTAMAVAAFGLYAATINLVPLLTGKGMDTHLAALAMGLCGTGQVLGRLGYPSLSARTRFQTRVLAVLAAGGVSILLLAHLSGPAGMVLAAAVLAGSVRGLLTLLRATAVADLWGTQAFGRVNGVFSAPITAAAALAPGGGALLADMTGGYPTALTVLALLTLTAAFATTAMTRRAPVPAMPSSSIVGKTADGRAGTATDSA